MSKVKILDVTFIVVLAFGILPAASACAAQWLKGGKEITKQELAVTSGTWTITGKGIFNIGELKVECNGKLTGSVGPKAEGLATEATDQAKLIDCTIKAESVVKCTGVGTLALVEAEHLSWKTELLEPKANEFVDDFKTDGNGKPAFKVFCLLETGKWTSELCEGNITTGPLTNESGGVSGEIVEAASEKCNSAGNTAKINAKGLATLALTSEVLSISK